MTFNVPPLVTDDIKAIADLSIVDLTVFIETAVVYVEEILGDKGLSDSILRLIAKNLSAHFAFLREGQIKTETIGPTSTTFNVMSGMGLNATTFGQQAMFLDSSKTLAKLNDPNRNSNKTIFEVY